MLLDFDPCFNLADHVVERLLGLEKREREELTQVVSTSGSE